jgi:hypothetical protein
MRHEHAWITRRVDIARHWIATHPAPALGSDSIETATLGSDSIDPINRV